MTEPPPEPELQASADLSPVSPSPVHTAPSAAVPVLQDTVDTIDAMVAAAYAQNVDAPIDPNLADRDASHDEVVDDDSFTEDYAEAPDAQQSLPAHQPESEDAADDYAKTFDSDMDEQNGTETEVQIEQETSDQPKLKASTTQPSTAESQTGTSGPANGGNQASDAAPPPSKDNAAIDIQRLMTELTSQSAQRQADPNSGFAQDKVVPEVKNAVTPALPSTSSLPPRPPMPSEPQAYKPEHYHPGQPNSHAANGAGNPQIQRTLNNQKPAPNVAQQQSGFPKHQSQPQNSHEDQYKRKWDQFVEDERQYMTEAKWDRFPEGSRIFIGNLTSGPVDKRDIFDVFHKFGRIAQISLKSAYGFVQFHTIDEGRAAIQHLEGAEIKGRRVHLEVSKLQDKSKKERARSPDRARRDSGRDGRDGRDSRRTNRYNDGSNDYRNSRGPSPRRSDEYQWRNDQYPGGRPSYSGGRDRRRSRSPTEYGRNAYRRRSPSPPRLPAIRYGSDVPDVQLLPQLNASPTYTDRNICSTWIGNILAESQHKSLKTDVTSPDSGGDPMQLVGHYLREGVRAVVEADFTKLVAQSEGIPVKIWTRSVDGSGKFDEYASLTAGDTVKVVHQIKMNSTLEALVAQADPATIQRMMATLGAPAHGTQPHAPPPGQPHQAYGAPPAQPDVQAVLASLGVPGHYTAPQAPAPQQYAPPYAGYQPQGPQSGADALTLQNIMSQLNRRA